MNAQNTENATLTPEYDSVAVCGETSLTEVQRFQLFFILHDLDVKRRLSDYRARGLNTESEAVKPEGKRMGVWVDGKLRFQSRDHEAIYDYADRKMRPYTKVINREAHVITHDVWVAPIGSFQVN